MVFLSNKELKKAEDLLKEAVILDPEYDVLWGYLSEWHFQKKEFKKAFATCSKGLNLNPQNATLHHTMGNILRMTNQKEEALVAYEKALEFGSRHPATYRSIAELKGFDIEEDTTVVQALFDQYADSFDQELQEKLGYDTPAEAYALYKNIVSSSTITAVLDLGCGTGYLFFRS